MRFLVGELFTFILLINSISCVYGFGIFETRYIEEDFRVFKGQYSEKSRYHVSEVSLKYLLDDYILEVMNRYVDSADNYVIKKNGDIPPEPRKVIGRSAFSERVKAAPYLVMKYDIDKKGSTYPANWEYAYSEANAAEQEIYLKEKAQKIADYIMAARTCFDVDPTILTALIHKESFFSPVAESFRGAVGLTQFTQIAFGEIAMQTGTIPNEADKDAIAYNLNGIDCMKSVSGEEIPLIDEIYTDRLYYRSSGGHNAIHPKAIATLKEYFKDHMLASITYGSILLKTYLAFECRLAPGRKCTPDNEGKLIWDKEYLYKKALQRYNGDVNYDPHSGKKVKEDYANDIWKEATTEILNKMKENEDYAKMQADRELQKKVEIVPIPKEPELSKVPEEKKDSKSTNVFMRLWNYFNKDN